MADDIIDPNTLEDEQFNTLEPVLTTLHREWTDRLQKMHSSGRRGTPHIAFTLDKDSFNQLESEIDAQQRFYLQPNLQGIRTLAYKNVRVLQGDENTVIELDNSEE